MISWRWIMQCNPFIAKETFITLVQLALKQKIVSTVELKAFCLGSHKKLCCRCYCGQCPPYWDPYSNIGDLWLLMFLSCFCWHIRIQISISVHRLSSDAEGYFMNSVWLSKRENQQHSTRDKGIVWKQSGKCGQKNVHRQKKTKTKRKRDWTD